MRVAGVTSESIVDGLGIRYVVFVQGCRHNCKGCHNPSTHSMTGGQEIDINTIANDIISCNIIDGITLSGGDPMYQPKECLELIKAIHKTRPELDVWCYTGYTIEELLDKNDSMINSLLGEIDILVDGGFEIDKKTLDRPFIGSSNQRIINLRETDIQTRGIKVLKIDI